MKVRLFRVVALAVVIGGLVPVAAAASCVQTTVAERAAMADVVVYGTVTETRQTFAAAGGVIRFRPERFLKGTFRGEVEVYLGPSRGGAVTSVDYQAALRGEQEQQVFIAIALAQFRRGHLVLSAGPQARLECLERGSQIETGSRKAGTSPQRRPERQPRSRLPKVAVSPRTVPKPLRFRCVQIPPIEPGGFEAGLICS